MGEREHLVRPENMATTSTAVSTVPQPLPEEAVERVVITLRPNTTLTEPRKKVVWTEDTVDNENMNKKKSKCCCIYVKPRKFDESDSESNDSECEHCFGHVEKKKKRATPHAHQRAIIFTDTEQESAAPVTIASITLQSEPAPSESGPSPPEQAPAPPENAPAPPDKVMPAS